MVQLVSALRGHTGGVTAGGWPRGEGAPIGERRRRHGSALGPRREPPFSQASVLFLSEQGASQDIALLTWYPEKRTAVGRFSGRRLAIAYLR
jgi:hypothetical protein